MNGRQLGDLLRQEIEAWTPCSIAAAVNSAWSGWRIHPWLGPLRVDQWRRFHVVHGFHHLTAVAIGDRAGGSGAGSLRMTSKNLVEKLQVPAQRPLA